MIPRTTHAALRCAQRRVTDDQIEFVLHWGAELKQAYGRVAFHLGHRELEYAIEAGATPPAGVLHVAVVLGPDQALITTVRSPDRTRLRTFRAPHRSRRRKRS